MAGQAEIIVSVTDVAEVQALIDAAEAVVIAADQSEDFAPDGCCLFCWRSLGRGGHGPDCPIGPLEAALLPFKEG